VSLEIILRRALRHEEKNVKYRHSIRKTHTKDV